ncbi:MAG: ABC transporter ATP-binding protein [Eubacteriales bacterium]|nr:ABC transporter ATP-binding protein [Eubacteriales bacterium]
MDRIEVKGLHKKFRGYPVLNGISCSFEAGKIYGLVGRNGSGKTVLLKCICGFLIPTEGEIWIDGVRKKDGELLNRAGIIIEEPAFLGNVSGLNNLKYLYGIRNRPDKKKLRNVMNQMGLNADDKKAVSKYSLGMRQRLALAQALMEEPELLLLDEPMNGLDEKGAAEIRSLLLQWKREGRLIILASHNRDDIEILCDAVYEMDAGRLRPAACRTADSDSHECRT